MAILIAQDLPDSDAVSGLHSCSGMLINPSPLAQKIIGAAIEVHRALGPGLLESTYDSCLSHEFHRFGLDFQRQVPIPVVYKSVRLDCGYRADFIVERTIVLEIKSVDRCIPIYRAQMITYVRLLGLHRGMLINFNVLKLVDGLTNVLV